MLDKWRSIVFSLLLIRVSTFFTIFTCWLFLNFYIIVILSFDRICLQYKSTEILKVHLLGVYFSQWLKISENLNLQNISCKDYQAQWVGHSFATEGVVDVVEKFRTHQLVPQLIPNIPDRTCEVKPLKFLQFQFENYTHVIAIFVNILDYISTRFVHSAGSDISRISDRPSTGGIMGGWSREVLHVVHSR